MTGDNGEAGAEGQPPLRAFPTLLKLGDFRQKLLKTLI
jgi:hypothetical protein